MNNSKVKNDTKALIGITVKKEEDHAQWYSEVITKAELIEYYDISGCYILRPYVYELWEGIQQFVDKRFKLSGIKNCYFPMFVTKGRLEAEANHVDGFSAEVAWVTKYGTTDLQEPLAIRPTSETIMYPVFNKWIRSHRDLPLKLNQWCSAVRWEFSHPTPFIRTREFLWQEGHIAHETGEEALKETINMLNVYQSTYEELCAIPVTAGYKSELEKFAGGVKTFTVEAFVPTTGRSIQAATSHYLGTNFATLFDLQFENANKEQELVHQCSFGLSTRSLGAIIMIHGDDKGLVLPPRIAGTQVVIVPIVKKGIDEDKLYQICKDVMEQLASANIRVFCDDRALYNPGWKYNHWELKGVPIRIEIGPMDMERGTARIVRRVDGIKMDIQQTDVVSKILDQLNDIHNTMYQKARDARDAQLSTVSSFDEVMPALNRKHRILAPWCNEKSCEEHVKAETSRLSKLADTTLSGSMKTLCTPLEQGDLPPATKCFACEREAVQFTLWGRSY